MAFIVFERWNPNYNWQEKKSYPTLQQAKKSIWDRDIAVESKHKDGTYFKFATGKEYKIVPIKKAAKP